MEIAEFISRLKALIDEAEGSPVVVPPPVIVTPVTPIVGAYVKDDVTPRPFPAGSQWLIDELHGAPYLQGRGWWLARELAVATGTPLTILQGCPLTGVYEASPAHKACDTPGGGLMEDIKYPSLNGELDVAKMRAIIDRFLAICCPIIPGKEYLDTANQSEIRIGEDVWNLVKTDKYIVAGNINPHIQIDNKFHHRFDDKEFPHCHIKWQAP